MAKGAFGCRHSRRHALARADAKIGKRLLVSHSCQSVYTASAKRILLNNASETLAFWLSSRLWKI